MKIKFTKMQGAGNDFVVLDETRGRLNLSVAQYRFLADRHFGVGADQILSVRAAPEGSHDIDFSYAIHNNDGGEVEHCGNGARCFVRFVRDQGLTTKDTIKVQTMNRVLTLNATPDGQVTVDMGAPSFAPDSLPFDPEGLAKSQTGVATLYAIDLSEKYIENHSVCGINNAYDAIKIIANCNLDVAVVSMGNPHAVHIVSDAETFDVARVGPLLATHPRFARGVNSGFMQIVNRSNIILRVYERGAGETLACGTGACAAVAAGIRQGLLDGSVAVKTHGGMLRIDWQGGDSPVMMTGPASKIFDSEIEIPNV
ncbi:MAG TPA: diaminopimelate epimerase [Burkholderiaceae bacterium]|nr:diaminopimelate epimerase [Burkholderiaceae bacterium]